MKILLISANPTIEKLFTLSAEKKGDDVIIGNREFVPEDNFEAVFLEKDLYDEEFLNSLKEKFKNAKFVLILSKKDEKLPGFDTYLTKPFLPTDLMDILEKLPNMQNETKENFDIENFNEDLDLEEENFDLENTQKEDIDDFALDDIDELVEEGDEKPDFEELEELENLPEDEVLITEDELLEEAPDSDIEDTISISEEELQNLEDENEEGEEVPSSQEESEKLKVKSENEEVPGGQEESEEVPSSQVPSEEEEEMPEIETKEDINTQKDENNEDLELESINEKDLAKALGEEIEGGEEVPSGQEPSTQEKSEKLKVKNEELPEIEENKKAPNEEVTSTQEDNGNIHEKTLGSILNINWDELKKAKAKVTITIDFGD
ncbi:MULTISPECIES: response regulator transcription factor [unclassified Lebetimonas]|uniref:response regulator transcription factor n=1 Tax=unclassified Lebetimonas TaxID=2648158 RepID=UPI0004663B15|nr:MULTISPECIES: response regulator transcription factor [unclassified Lebetimonas]